MSQPLDIPSCTSTTTSTPSNPTNIFSTSSTNTNSLPDGSPMSISPTANIKMNRLASQSSSSSTPKGNSAAGMLRAASAIAAQASTGSAGLQAVSSALLGQAQAQAQAGGLSFGNIRSESQDAMTASTSTSVDQGALELASRGRASFISGMESNVGSSSPRKPSTNAQYAASMSAHIGGALQAQVNDLNAAASTSKLDFSLDSDQKQVGNIAARAAVEEAQSQVRVQAFLNNKNNNNNQTSLASTSSNQPQPPTSFSSYLSQLGLEHIPLPSEGLEQSWGRDPLTSSTSNSSRPSTSTSRKGKEVEYWNKGENNHPSMGFSLSGVPSLPLMPTPPLQMLPPTSPNSNRNGFPFSPPSSSSNHFNHSTRRASKHKVHNRNQSSSTSSSTSKSSNGGNGSGFGFGGSGRNHPYPFQVVQTPGGTARAGWWVPTSEVDSEKKSQSTLLSGGRISRTPRLDRIDSDQGRTEVESKTEGIQEPPILFQPSYHVFTSDEFMHLASAAAYATAALTSSSLSQDGNETENWKPLTAEQQSGIAEQLRAWAGLEGPERQVEARIALEKRQAQIVKSLNASTTLDDQDSLKAEASSSNVGQKNSAINFFPPDFASHYRTQLRSLAEGYYTRLYKDAQQEESGEISQPPSTSTSSTVMTTSTTQDPMQILAEASNAAGLDVQSPHLRDQLLQYAHGLYSTGSITQPSTNGDHNTSKTVLHPTLLPLLHTLHDLQPNHLPTLLLLSCAYYSSGNHSGSLYYNNLILKKDPDYVEAMSNIGTTVRALGRWKEAEGWWWKAIKLRPGYWDAYENLLGVLCFPQQSSDGNQISTSQGPRFAEALQLCDFVESSFSKKKDQYQTSENQLPEILSSSLPLAQVPRMQNLYYAKGNLKYVIPELGSVPAALEYQKAVEICISPSQDNCYDLRDLIVATSVVGILSMGSSVPGSAASTASFEVAAAIGLDPCNSQHASLASSGMFSSLIPGGILKLVRRSGDHLVRILLRLGNGQLPMIMLLPESASKLTQYLFSETNGILPSMAIDSKSQSQSQSQLSIHQQSTLQATQTTSTILLTLAKLIQDSASKPISGPHGSLNLGGLPPSISLVLPLYYLSLSLQSSASTCNNLGILLSNIPVVTTVINSQGQPQQLNGQALAMQYYMQGLSIDPKHPHLYTNLGSLLKDLGHLNEAVQMYEKAVECNPTFDVALANLGNAIKDQGRTQDSVSYYRRAVRANPRFPEALCGLVNALLAVCDWKEVYSEDPNWPGWMASVSELVSSQLDEGAQYGMGVLQSEGSVQHWLDVIVRSIGDSRPSTITAWKARLVPFYQNTDREVTKINEGSFTIRLIERLTKSIQRRWYLDVYGQTYRNPSASTTKIQPTSNDVQKYPKLNLPSSLSTPAPVPCVLPFHTFTYPLSARQVRLISHRNALRISQNTLSQTWRAPHVYPPPQPPSPKINIGYISSDFNNHPLAHLMQSVFGFHDLNRFNVCLYATTASDGSPYRQKIEREAQHFVDCSSWSHQRIVEQVISDGIHVLMNLNGYTKGARNEVFAARPCPVQMEFMGFAGGLASSWTDYIVSDPIVTPPSVSSVDRWRSRSNLEPISPGDFGADLDPESLSEEWVYTERFIYMPSSYFVNDHAQGFREPTSRISVAGDGIAHPHQMTDDEAWSEEEERRWKSRKELFPTIPDDFFIFADFNQLYKCDPMLFKLWLRILARTPRSILWLLRFPASGEAHLLESARRWAGDEVASRVVFTDVAPKHIHIHRGRIADLFLDTTECNAHTTAADILWSGTPVLTWPRHTHKMCSRVAASIVEATGLGEGMVVDSEQAYEDKAVELANSVSYVYVDREGRSLDPILGSSINAGELKANSHAVAAQPHGNGSNIGNSQGQGQTSGPVFNDPSTSTPSVPSQPQSQIDKSISAWGHPPLRSSIQIPPGPSCPPNAVSRRASGSLSNLRRSLFLTRDQSPLFDTRGWVRALEKGYEEAWRRWVAGTDREDSEEWERLSEDSQEKKSGHIWLTMEDMK